MLLCLEANSEPQSSLGLLNFLFYQGASPSFAPSFCGEAGHRPTQAPQAKVNGAPPPPHGPWGREAGGGGGTVSTGQLSFHTHALHKSMLVFSLFYLSVITYISVVAQCESDLESVYFVRL